jgi:hypothetical protein
MSSVMKGSFSRWCVKSDRGAIGVRIDPEDSVEHNARNTGREAC